MGLLDLNRAEPTETIVGIWSGRVVLEMNIGKLILGVDDARDLARRLTQIADAIDPPHAAPAQGEATEPVKQ